jgi:hypothetical protein
MDEVVKAIVILAMVKPLKEFVCPLYMRTIEEMAEAPSADKARVLCDTASVIERIGLLRDADTWCAFMQNEVNPEYKPHNYFQL